MAMANSSKCNHTLHKRLGIPVDMVHNGKLGQVHGLDSRRHVLMTCFDDSNMWGFFWDRFRASKREYSQTQTRVDCSILLSFVDIGTLARLRTSQGSSMSLVFLYPCFVY